MKSEVNLYVATYLAGTAILLSAIYFVGMRHLERKLQGDIKRASRAARRCYRQICRKMTMTGASSTQEQAGTGASVALLPAARFTIGEIAQFLLPEWHERAAQYHGRLLIVTHVSADGDRIDGYILPADKHARVNVLRRVMASDLRTTGGKAVELLDVERLQEELAFRYKIDSEPWIDAGEIYRSHQTRSTSLI